MCLLRLYGFLFKEEATLKNHLVVGLFAPGYMLMATDESDSASITMWEALFQINAMVFTTLNETHSLPMFQSPLKFQDRSLTSQYKDDALLHDS